MAKFLGTDIPRRLARGFRGKLARGVIIKTTSAPDPADPTRIIKTRVEHACTGFFEEWPGDFPSQESARPGTRVQRRDYMAAVLGSTIAGKVQPEVDDGFRMKGLTFTIVKIGFDPTFSTGPSAIYKLTLRGN